MTSTRRIARSSARRWWVMGLGAVVALIPLVSTAAVSDIYYERAVMAAANTRCRLFTPAIGSALEASRAQARGAALRSGIDSAALAQVEGRAKAKARATPCNSTDLSAAAVQVRSSFEAYSRQRRQVFEGDVADWTAERSLGARTISWGLSQPVSFGRDRMTFGLAGRDGAAALVAVVQFADGAQPYTARLTLRDESRTSGPFLDQRRTNPQGRLPLAARVAPTGYTRSYSIEAKGPSDARLLSTGARAATSFRFPEAAAAAMASLDPREAVQIDFVFSGRTSDVVRTAYVEVGDFAAGRIFALAQR